MAGTPAAPHAGRSRAIVTVATVAAIVVVVAIIAIVRGSGGSPSSPTPTRSVIAPAPGSTSESTVAGTPVALDQLKVTNCAADFIGQVEAQGTVHNAGPARANFAIIVVVKNAQGTQVDSTTAIANNVAPNAVAHWDADDFPTDYEPGLVCTVVSARRTIATT